MKKLFRPIFEKYQVDACFSGHEHNLQYIKPPGYTSYFVSGAGSETTAVIVHREGGVFAKSENWSYILTLTSVFLHLNQPHLYFLANISFGRSQDELHPIPITQIVKQIYMRSRFFEPAPSTRTIARWRAGCSGPSSGNARSAGSSRVALLVLRFINRKGRHEGSADVRHEV